MAPVRTLLPGGRWHFAHGPIELVIAADGHGGDCGDDHRSIDSDNDNGNGNGNGNGNDSDPNIDRNRRLPGAAVAFAHEAAWRRFASVLPELVAELPLLRQPVRHGPCPLQGIVARRMWQACAALPTHFITPMAAVAGAVAQEIVAVYAAAGLRRAYVNNGGDIALHLAQGAAWRVGWVADITGKQPGLDGAFAVHSADPVRGIATSGWRGRSHSLGIADAVTVLAASAAVADAAATLIANAVNCDDARIQRAPACSLRDDSDLGNRLVTVHVPALPAPMVNAALQAGQQLARRLHLLGLIHAAVLACQGQTRSVQPQPALLLAA